MHLLLGIEDTISLTSATISGSYSLPIFFLKDPLALKGRDDINVLFRAQCLLRLTLCVDSYGSLCDHHLLH